MGDGSARPAASITTTAAIVATTATVTVGADDEARERCRDACDCCVPEADVVVHARAGEVRIVPFRLANRWRREREVTLAVGPWHVCGGPGLEIRGVLEEEKLVLAPCEDRVVRLMVSVGGRDLTNTDTTNTGGTSDQGRDTTQAGDTNQARAGDVDECVSAYADVRFEGCSRPDRVAVVVSPADAIPSTRAVTAAAAAEEEADERAHLERPTRR